MPTLLPTREPQARTLSWPETVRFFVLLARLRWLDRQLEAANLCNRRAGTEQTGDRLWAVAVRWLAIHARISALLGIPEPPHVAQVRAVLRPFTKSRSSALTYLKTASSVLASPVDKNPN